VHLVGLIIRIYHDAQSLELQMNINICLDVTPWSLLCLYRLPVCNHQLYDKVFCNYQPDFFQQPTLNQLQLNQHLTSYNLTNT